MSDTGLLNAIEADLRALSAEARRADNLGHQLTAFLTAPQQQIDLPQIKDSAEKAVLQLRTLSRDASGIHAIRQAPDFIEPFLFACETKTAKLVQLALASLHKLLTHDAAPPGLDRLVEREAIAI